MKDNGLVCHHAIKVCCEIIGIKDMYAKVQGARNVKAFFIDLLQQKSYQQLADEKQLHLIDFKSENRNYPVVLALPVQVRKSEVPSNESLDFIQYVMGNRVMLKKKKLPSFFTKLTSYKKRLVRLERTRNSNEARIQASEIWEAA